MCFLFLWTTTRVSVHRNEWRNPSKKIAKSLFHWKKNHHRQNWSNVNFVLYMRELEKRSTNKNQYYKMLKMEIRKL